jgi:DOPA 4,5-dioxygenase
VNPPSQTLSSAYTTFPPPLDSDSRRGAFDVHVYFLQSSPDQTAFAKALWERVRREFPELRVYRVWEEPVGPHPVGMFEVNLFTVSEWERPSSLECSYSCSLGVCR